MRDGKMTRRESLRAGAIAAFVSTIGGLVAGIMLVAAVGSGMCTDNGQCGTPTSAATFFAELAVVLGVMLPALAALVRYAPGGPRGWLVSCGLALVMAPMPVVALVPGIWAADHLRLPGLSSGWDGTVGWLAAALGYTAAWCALLRLASGAAPARPAGNP